MTRPSLHHALSLYYLFVCIISRPPRCLITLCRCLHRLLPTSLPYHLVLLSPSSRAYLATLPPFPSVFPFHFLLSIPSPTSPAPPSHFLFLLLSSPIVHLLLLFLLLFRLFHRFLIFFFCRFYLVCFTFSWSSSSISPLSVLYHVSLLILSLYRSPSHTPVAFKFLFSSSSSFSFIFILSCLIYLRLLTFVRLSLQHQVFRGEGDGRELLWKA